PQRPRRGDRRRQRGRPGDAGQRRHPAPLLPGLGHGGRRRHLRPARLALQGARGLVTAPGVPGEDLAQALYRARRDRVPVPPLTGERPELTAAEAYAVQRRLVELLQADGEGGIVGYKLGLTSRAMQEQLGIDEPDYGPVLAGGVHPDGVRVDLDRLIQPKVEAEIAIV